MFGPSVEQVEEINKTQAINSMAIMCVLVEKGLATVAEFEAAKVKATAIIDQQYQEAKAEALRQFDEDHPGTRKLFGKLMGMPTED